MGQPVREGEAIGCDGGFGQAAQDLGNSGFDELARLVVRSPDQDRRFAVGGGRVHHHHRGLAFHQRPSLQADLAVDRLGQLGHVGVRLGECDGDEVSFYRGALVVRLVQRGEQRRRASLDLGEDVSPRSVAVTGDHGGRGETFRAARLVPLGLLIFADQPAPVRADPGLVREGCEGDQRGLVLTAFPVFGRHRDQVFAWDQLGAQVEDRRRAPVGVFSDTFSVDENLRLVVAADEQLGVLGNFFQHEGLPEPRELPLAGRVRPDPGEVLELVITGEREDGRCFRPGRSRGAGLGQRGLLPLATCIAQKRLGVVLEKLQLRDAFLDRPAECILVLQDRCDLEDGLGVAAAGLAQSRLA